MLLQGRNKYAWSAKRGHIANNNELASLLREIADREAEAGVSFNIIETAGLSMRRVLQVSNPLESRGCDSPDCLLCKDGRGNGGNCRGSGTNYEIECQLCPDDERSVYIGESSRNLYTRCKEHVSRYQAGTVTSFMAKHQTTAHQGQEASYKAKVTASTRDCLTR